MSAACPQADSEHRKRTRISHEEDDCADARADEEFWFDDGTIVLLAGEVKFRVYRGVLMEHSPVFVEMLSLPQPAESQPGAQYSCPVIRLHDHSEDLRHVFRLLMPRKTAQFVADSAPTIHMVSAYIRIAHKYQMEALLGQWIGYLKKHFSDSFDVWISHRDIVPAGFGPIHAIGVVNLARLTSCNSILPTALAVCTTLGNNIVTGFTREDGTHEMLSMADLGRCFHAKGRLIQENAEAVATAMNPGATAAACNTESLCLRDIRSLAGFVAQCGEWLAPEGPVPSWSQYQDYAESVCSICTHCLEMMQDDYHSGQRLVWSRLPDIMGVDVDGWN